MSLDRALQQRLLRRFDDRDRQALRDRTVETETALDPPFPGSSMRLLEGLVAFVALVTAVLIGIR